MFTLHAVTKYYKSKNEIYCAFDFIDMASHCVKLLRNVVNGKIKFPDILFESQTKKNQVWDQGRIQDLKLGVAQMEWEIFKTRCVCVCVGKTPHTN